MGFFPAYTYKLFPGLSRRVGFDDILDTSAQDLRRHLYHLSISVLHGISLKLSNSILLLSSLGGPNLPTTDCKPYMLVLPNPKSPKVASLCYGFPNLSNNQQCHL